MELWFASFNSGKLKELKNLFMGKDFDLHSASELTYYSAPPETGNSFEENAKIKARSLRALKPNTWVMAEDSGLEVTGLNNLPGIHSARYAGPKARDAENTAKLLKMLSLKSANNREAQFKCSLVVITPEGQEKTYEGVLKGEIAKQMKGTQGFGYDNVFIPEGETQTLAELGLAFKNKCSHRSQAIKKFLQEL